MFHTPPIKASHTTTTTIETSEDDPLSSGIRLVNEDSDNEDDDDDLPQGLPRELNELVLSFLKDLKAPKYNNPISAEQLSLMFQDFYSLFQYRAELFVKGSVFYKTRVHQIEMLTKEEQVEKRKTLAQFDKRVTNYVELAENEITVRYFDKLFKKFDEDVVINDYIKRKIAALQKVRGIDYENFIDVEGIDLRLPVFQTISQKLNELERVKPPSAKLALLLDIHSSINTVVKEQLHTTTVSGDHILPLFIYIILIHSENTDLYLHFLYISRFRNSAQLNGEPLYCLTNLEAALMYTRTLILTQESLDFSLLSDDEYLLLSQPSDLPVRKSSIVQISESSVMSSVPTTAEGIKSLGMALDTGLKSFVSRLGGTENVEYNPLKGLAAGVMKWRSATPTNVDTIVESGDGKLTREKSQEKSSLDGLDLNKFEGVEFKDLTITQLEQVWKDYQLLVGFVKKVENDKVGK